MLFVPYTEQPLYKDWKLNVINFTLSNEDIKRIKLFCADLGTLPTPYMQVFAVHTWKVAFTPQWGGEAGWLTLACKARDHPLNGKTINIADVDVSAWLHVGAWVVEFMAGCTEGQLNAFLNGGSQAAVEFDPETAKNQELDADIPF
jgi:hypothetical protein